MRTLNVLIVAVLGLSLLGPVSGARARVPEGQKRSGGKLGILSAERAERRMREAREEIDGPRAALIFEPIVGRTEGRAVGAGPQGADPRGVRIGDAPE
jgi:hypothetical protein